jgi:hypothetical protein
MTYARRYTLAAIVGVVQIDDDGEAAMDRESTQPCRQSPVPRETIPAKDLLVEDRHLQKLATQMTKLKADTTWINKTCENLFKTSPRGLKVSQFNEFMTILETMKCIGSEGNSAV